MQSFSIISMDLFKCFQSAWGLSVDMAINYRLLTKKHKLLAFDQHKLESGHIS